MEEEKSEGDSEVMRFVMEFPPHQLLAQYIIPCGGDPILGNGGFNGFLLPCADEELKMKQIASYADQVQEMKGRIQWLQESLRHRSSRPVAEERAEDLGKFFAVQSIKVEELGQEIDVFSEQLRQWEDVDGADNRFSALARAVLEGEALNRLRQRPVENVRIHLSDLLKLPDDQMKRKALTVRNPKPSNDAKRRKVHESSSKMPFRIGVSTSKRTDSICDKRKSQGGVRTSQLRQKATAEDSSCIISSLQRELLQLKEVLEERDEQLCEERRKRSELEKRHETRIKEALKLTEHLNHEQALRAQAEERVIELEVQLKKALVYQEEPSSVVEVTVNDEAVSEPDTSKDQAQNVPVGKSGAGTPVQSSQALKLKSIAEAKVENLKKQVAALKKLTGELQHHQEQQSRLRKDSMSVEIDKLQIQLAHFKKLAAEKSRELEVEQTTRADDQSKTTTALLRLENEAISHKKLAHERAAELKAERKQKAKVESQLKEVRYQLEAKAQSSRTESQSCDTISHKQTRRLQATVKKARQKYEQLQEMWRKEQDGRMSADSECRKLSILCASHVARLDGVESLVEHLSREVDEQLVADTTEEDMETSEKLLFLLDKLAKQEGTCVAERKPEKLVAEIRKQVGEMKHELSSYNLAGKMAVRKARGDNNSGAAGQGQGQVDNEKKLVELLEEAKKTMGQPEEQVVRLGRICAVQAKKLRSADSKLVALKKQVERMQKSTGRCKVLEIELLEYKRQAEEKTRDIKHERSLRFELERSMHKDKEDTGVQVGIVGEEEELSMEMQVFVLEELVGEKCEALVQEHNQRVELVSYAQAEMAVASRRAEELSQVTSCQGHKVLELTGLLEFFVAKLDEYHKYQAEIEDDKSRMRAALLQEQADKHKLEAKLDACDKDSGSLKKHVQDLELSEEVLRYRDKVWRRGLLAFDQVLLLCFAALFAFSRMTILLRDIVPT